MGNKNNTEIESTLTHIEKYRNIHINPRELTKFKDVIIPQIRKREISLHDISISRLPRDENLDFLFNNNLDFKTLRTKRLSFLGCGLKNDDILRKFTEIDSLDIRGNFLKEFPSIMNLTTTLTRLNIMGLRLKELPEYFGDFTGLTYINISENFFTEFTDNHIKKMGNLENLLCYDNKITQFLTIVPPTVTFLDASKNEIKVIPSKYPPTMKELYFHYNKIEKIDVSGLKELERLGVSNNRLLEINLKGCVKLNNLDLANNRLCDDSIIGLSDCVNLQDISVPLNNLTEKIFESLGRSNMILKMLVGYNNISTIPSDLVAKNKHLQYLDVSGNHEIKEIPRSIVTLGENFTKLFFLLGDLPNLQEFPNERINEKLEYIFAWGTPIDESLIDRVSKDAPRCFFTDFQLDRNHYEEEMEGVSKKTGRTIKTAHCSMKGPFRPTNEDAYIDSVLLGGKYHLIAVLDGHGGRKASNVSAKYLPMFLSDLLEKRGVSPSSPSPSLSQSPKQKQDEKVIILNETELTELFRESISLTNEHLRSKNIQDGTTLVTILVDIEQDFFVVAGLGDSRGIMCPNDLNFEGKDRDDDEKVNIVRERIELTRDHKPTDLIELKWMEESEIHVLVNSKVDGKIGVSRALGDFRFELNAEPDFKVVRNISKEVDFVVLCCDGVFDVFESEEVLIFVKEMMEKKENIQVIANRIVNLSCSSGSRDNISAIIVDFGGNNDDEINIIKKEVVDDGTKEEEEEEVEGEDEKVDV